MDSSDGTQPHADWTTLPNEVLGTIFGYLTEHDRFNASLVCRSWYYGFCAPEAWRRFTLNIWRIKKHHRKFFPKRGFHSGGLPYNLLTVVARRVRCLEIECPWASDDRNGSLGVSLRLSSAFGDLRFRGCQLRALALKNFDRMSFSWSDSKARLRVMKSLKRFINNQRNLAIIDLRYNRLLLREVSMLLSAAAYRSAVAVTSIYIQGAFSYYRISRPDIHFVQRAPLQIYPRRIFHNQVQPNNVDAQEQEEFNQDWFQNNMKVNLGMILSRFTSLRNLHLLLDATVLGMELLRCLPTSVRLLNIFARRGEMETEEFSTALIGNSLCDSNKWKNLTERCPQLDLEIDMRGIIWYHPLHCILQPTAPLKRVRLFSPRDLSPFQLEAFLYHLIDLFSDSLENVDICIFASIGLDEFLVKLYQNCRCLKSLSFHGTIRNSSTVQSLCWDFAKRKISIFQLNVVVETETKKLFQQLSVMKYEILKWLNEDAEEDPCTDSNKNRNPWRKYVSNKTRLNFQFGVIRMPPQNK